MLSYVVDTVSKVNEQSGGWDMIIVAAISAVTTITIALITLRRTGMIKTTTQATFEDSQPNGGNSSRDILDRLDRRSLNQEERFDRLERRFDRLGGDVRKLHEGHQVLERISSTTHTQVRGINDQVVGIHSRLDTLEGGKE